MSTRHPILVTAAVARDRGDLGELPPAELDWPVASARVFVAWHAASFAS